jgi:hypothetical protein
MTYKERLEAALDTLNANTDEEAQEIADNS